MNAVKINVEQARLLRRYQTAMNKYLKASPRASLQPAFRLGRQAVALGLETLNLALIHEQALAALLSSRSSSKTRQSLIARAKGFFAEAIVPIEQTHRTALLVAVRIKQVSQTLRQRTAESSASTRRLERGIAQRQAAETVLLQSGKHRITLLQEAHRLQQCLRKQTRKMLSAQEDDWQKNSRQFRDEIAQTLLAINVRMLTLKTAANADTAVLTKEIAETQELVITSSKIIQRLAREYEFYRKT